MGVLFCNFKSGLDNYRCFFWDIKMFFYIAMNKKCFILMQFLQISIKAYIICPVSE